MTRRGRLSLLASGAACVAAAFAVGMLEPPPRGDHTDVGMAVVAGPAELMRTAGVQPAFDRSTTAGARIYVTDFGGYVVGSGVDPQHALERAYRAALAIVAERRRAEDARLRTIARMPGARAAAARRLLADPVRYRMVYQPPPAAEPDRSSAAFRAALPAALLAALLGILLGARGPRAVRPALVVPGAAAGVLLSLALSRLGPDAFAVAVGALGFLAALAWAFAGGERAVRLQLALIVVLAASRGAILSFAQWLELPRELLLVNAVQPALVGSVLLWLAWRWRGGRVVSVSRPLLVGLALIVAACVVPLATQTVGVTLYAIGLAQYLVYPAFALACWILLSPRDARRVVWLLAGVSIAVAASVVTDAAGITEFAQAASSERRHGGITGSYLHASIFLGTLAPLWVVAAAVTPSRRRLVAAAGAFALLVLALALTFGRAGFAIAAIGILAVTASFRGRELRRVGVLLAAGLVLAVPAGVAADAGPRAIGDRIASSFDWNGDRGNQQRLTSIRKAVRRWRDAPLPRKVLGEGLAATGNAKQLASRRTDSTESYPLKLLLEVGVVGALLIGGFLLWAAVQFARTALRRSVDPYVRGAAAGALALSVDALLYPTLETQILGMTWWLLLVLALQARDGLRVGLDRLRLRPAEGVDAPIARPAGDERQGELAGRARP